MAGLPLHRGNKMIIRTSKLTEHTQIIEKDGSVTLQKAIDISPVLQANYEDRKDSGNGWAKDRSVRRIARIPMETWLEWTKEEPALIVGDKELRDKLLKRKLLQEESKVFLTVNKGL